MALGLSLAAAPFLPTPQGKPQSQPGPEALPTISTTLGGSSGWNLGCLCWNLVGAGREVNPFIQPVLHIHQAWAQSLSEDTARA